MTVVGPDQVHWRRIKGLGKLEERYDRRIAPPALQIRDVLLREPRAFGELLLRHAQFGAKARQPFLLLDPYPKLLVTQPSLPGTKPAMGTVAIAGASTFGFGRRALREGAARAIKIYPQGLDGLLKETGGPSPPFTVGDYGDANIRNAPGSRFDIYRFSTLKGALKFGKITVPVIIKVPAGGHCPPGTSAQ